MRAQKCFINISKYFTLLYDSSAHLWYLASFYVVVIKYFIKMAFYDDSMIRCELLLNYSYHG